MIRVIFTVESGIVTGFELRGHAGFADAGSDIVCAAVSSAAYMTANTLTEVAALPCTVTEEDGHMQLCLSENDAKDAAAQTVLSGFLLHLNALCEAYADCIDIKISEV